MGNEINAKDFFKKVKEKIIVDTNIENYNLVKETIEKKNLNDYFKDCRDTKIIIPILKKVNEYFIKNCEIHINDLKIYPIETEIYFVNDWFHDGMCHMNKLQKERFGQLYFHRRGKGNKILCANPKTTWGGVDVCLSSSKDYCLSILIRSAFINGTTELVSGTRNICDRIKENCKENLQSFFENLEKNQDNKVRIFKRNDDEQTKIFSQPRISGKKYYGKTIDYKLNCLNLGEYLPKEDNYKYLKEIDIKYSIYTKTKKKKIIKEYKDSLQTKIY